MVNMQQLMQQAQKMQSELQKNHDKINAMEFVGDSAGGKIKVTMKGNYEVIKIYIGPELVNGDEKDMLEDLLIVAFNNCKDKIDAANKDSLGGIAGNLNLPF
ncbi:MAG: YbaB/EbfC family nucleoid-associated protein [Rickettsiales bacterium]|jgi:DNA-binding YbaB/EbfC family protein|nr:YbaB/EbfC family nucleoid-associated protein [Rickettsiales bacterium]